MGSSEAQKAALRRRRERSKAMGRCQMCHAREATDGKTTCERCRERERARARQRYHEAKARRICPRCRENPARDGGQECEACTQRRRQQQQQVAAQARQDRTCLRCYGKGKADPGSIYCAECREIRARQRREGRVRALEERRRRRERLIQEAREAQVDLVAERLDTRNRALWAEALQQLEERNLEQTAEDLWEDFRAETLRRLR